MKRFLGYCVLTVLTLVVVSCSSNGSEPTRSTEKTLFVFMPWSSGAEKPYTHNLYTYFSTNIQDMETAIAGQHGLGRTRLLVYIAQSPTRAALIEIRYTGKACTRDTLKHYADYDAMTAAGIAGILGDVRTHAEADTYAMIIGCHGTGWLPRGLTGYYKTRAFGGTEARFQADLADLADGITRAAMPMQFIAFDDCYMAGIEVAYDLKDVTHYLIASTSEIMAAGLPYRTIWPYLCATTPNYEAIVNGFYSYYSHGTYPYGTLSVIDCQQTEAMAQLMRTFNARYTFDPTQENRLQKLDGMGQTIFFDMGSYISHLCDAADVSQFDAMVARLVPYHVHTPKIYTNLSQVNGGFSTVDINTFSGITISDPTTNTYVAGRKSLTAWWKATHTQSTTAAE